MRANPAPGETKFAVMSSSLFRCCAAALIVAGWSVPRCVAADGVEMSRGEIVADAERMADAQLAQVAGSRQLDWVAAVMWLGYSDLAAISSRPDYAAAVDQFGASVAWTPRFRAKIPNHADDLCIAQTFLDAYTRKADAARLLPSEERIAAVSDYITGKELPDPPGATKTHLTWWWCDALFMAPAGHARLSAITGDRRYLDAMDEEWWRTAALLYDRQEHLFFRDISFLHKRSRHGNKIFWSRGNGWVFAGLARTLTYMPADYPSRARYVAIYREMAARLASLQREDGTWSPSLLDEAEFPDSETSGTALDCFAFAWGINHGVLDRKAYLPVIERAWAALLAARRPDGLPGYVQNVGAGPAPVSPAGTQLYATGAFLMAACQLAALAPLEIPPPPHLSSPVQPAAVASPSPSAPDSQPKPTP